MEPAIRTRDLTKRYGESRGIEGIELEVVQGEVFGFLGPNGAGKTTTMRLLLDLIRPTRGRAWVLGLDVQRDGPEARARVGYLPGELRLPERATGRETLGYLAGLRGGVAADRVEALAKRLGLDLDRRAGDLSKGNRQKVGLVAAFMHEPELLVLDEPASGLDPLRQEDVQEMIRGHAAGGGTVFLSSHDLDQVQHVAGRVGIVREGKLVAVERVADLRARALRRVEVRFDGPAPAIEWTAVPGVHDAVSVDGRVRLHVEGPMDALVKELARHPVATLSSEEPELEEIFLRYYGRTHDG